MDADKGTTWADLLRSPVHVLLGIAISAWTFVLCPNQLAKGAGAESFQSDHGGWVFLAALGATGLLVGRALVLAWMWHWSGVKIRRRLKDLTDNERRMLFDNFVGHEPVRRAVSGHIRSDAVLLTLQHAGMMWFAEGDTNRGLVTYGVPERAWPEVMRALEPKDEQAG